MPLLNGRSRASKRPTIRDERYKRNSRLGRILRARLQSPTRTTLSPHFCVTPEVSCSAQAGRVFLIQRYTGSARRLTAAQYEHMKMASGSDTTVAAISSRDTAKTIEAGWLKSAST